MSSNRDEAGKTPKVMRALVPALRFPEFRDAGEWEEKKLGDLSQILRGGSPRPIEDYLTSDVNGLNWLKIGDVDQSSKYITHTSEKVIMSALGKTREVNPGDLIMSNSMSFGRPYILKIKTCIHDGWIVVTNIVERIVVDYLYYLFLSPASKLYFLNNAAGAVVQNLNADIVKLLPVCLPSFEEQQKIADCLSSVDELITLEARKIDALKAHKKGLMQQLFPAEGETLPKLRFPEFRDAGEWEEKAIGCVCKMFSGGTPVTSRKSFYGGEIPFIRSAEIDKEKTELFLTQEGLDSSAAKLVTKGDLLLALYGANSGDVALAKIDGAINQAILCLKCEYSNVFIYQYLSYMQSRIVSMYIQGGQGNLSGDIVRSIKLFFPSRNEQRKIADCLTSVDELIILETKKLDALKAHKKGLMQQLFPSLGEVRE